MYGQIKYGPSAFRVGWFKLFDLITLSGTSNIVGNWSRVSNYVKRHIGQTYDDLMFHSFKALSKPMTGRTRRLRQYRVIGAIFDERTNKLTAVFPDATFTTFAKSDLVSMTAVSNLSDDSDIPIDIFVENFWRKNLPSSFGKQSVSMSFRLYRRPSW